MSNKASEYTSFEALKQRLDEIVAAVEDENLPLDDALDLYEEAVALGMRASDLLETGIEVEEDGADAEAQADAVQSEDSLAEDNTAQDAVHTSAPN